MKRLTILLFLFISIVFGQGTTRIHNPKGYWIEDTFVPFEPCLIDWECMTESHYKNVYHYEGIEVIEVYRQGDPTHYHYWSTSPDMIYIKSLDRAGYERICLNCYRYELYIKEIINNYDREKAGWNKLVERVLKK